MIYLDNAATTYPKPFSVLETVYRANRKYAYNSCLLYTSDAADD